MAALEHPFPPSCRAGLEIHHELVPSICEAAGCASFAFYLYSARLQIKLTGDAEEGFPSAGSLSVYVQTDSPRTGSLPDRAFVIGLIETNEEVVSRERGSFRAFESADLIGYIDNVFAKRFESKLSTLVPSVLL